MNSDREELLKVLNGRTKKKDYHGNRVTEIMDKFNAMTTLEEMYDLGFATATGMILYLLDIEELTKAEIKEHVIKRMLTQEQTKTDAARICMDLTRKG
ncbi:MAG: hypothetical protein RBT49_18255 [Bacteroidales bacterium]|jgi:hypothetical protein|nr:hypothetical protein [Bacteroidales bacterium]